jgi:hypothetical protein
MIGAPAAWFRNGVCIGPLASFNAPDTWTPHPPRDGIVLIGEAGTEVARCPGIARLPDAILGLAARGRCLGCRVRPILRCTALY